MPGESGVAARLVPATVDGLILAAPEADRISVGAALMRFARGHYGCRWYSPKNQRQASAQVRPSELEVVGSGARV